MFSLVRAPRTMAGIGDLDMALNSTQIPVVDVFAGPGGLGEGFSRFLDAAGQPPFRVVLSIEKDRFAHRTLLLRSLYRRFHPEPVPSIYYDYVRGQIARKGDTLERLLESSAEGRAASTEAHQLELGPRVHTETDRLIRKALGKGRSRGSRPWVLIGGPPCQAYSLAGRSRMLPTRGEAFYKDERHTLYREYLRLIRVHRPTVFVMENVKGILSSQHRSRLIIERILRDLAKPGEGLRYELFPLGEEASDRELFESAPEPARFVIQAERFGVPQARHRVIILGVLTEDATGLRRRPGTLTPVDHEAHVADVLADLPPLRSGLSSQDSVESWQKAIRAARRAPWLGEVKSNGLLDVGRRIKQTLATLAPPPCDRGGRFVPFKSGNVRSKNKEASLRRWLNAPELKGALNHEARGHMPSDLHRYLFAACYADERQRSPRLEDFPVALRPAHRNVQRAVDGALFNDRFRVQRWNAAASTVTSHISKDGHYTPSPEPTQCRSLPIREPSRLQTFSDNYHFCAPFIAQHVKVDNAVPRCSERLHS